MLGRQIFTPRRVALVAFAEDLPELNLGMAVNALVADPAVDLARLNASEYWRRYFPPEMVEGSLVEGQRPTWFTISPLTSAQLMEAPPRVKGGEARRTLWLVRCGLVAVDNYAVVDENGREVHPPAPDRKDSGSGPMCSAEWVLERSLLSPRDLLALGLMIEHISVTSHPSLRQSAGPSGPGAGAAGKTAAESSPTPPTAATAPGSGA